MVGIGLLSFGTVVEGPESIIKALSRKHGYVGLITNPCLASMDSLSNTPRDHPQAMPGLVPLLAPLESGVAKKGSKQAYSSGNPSYFVQKGVISGTPIWHPWQPGGVRSGGWFDNESILCKHGFVIKTT